MAKFFGTVQGGRGKATRLGHKDLKVTAQSYAGSIIVNLYYNEAEQMDCCEISIGQSSTEFSGYTMYHGPIKGLFNDQVDIRKAWSAR